MARSLSRREFNHLALYALLGLLLGGSNRTPAEYPNVLQKPPRRDQVTGIELDKDDDELNFNEVRQLALYFKDAFAALNLADWRVPLTEESLLAWAQEVSLQMEAEDIVDKPPVPKELSFFEPEDGSQANHQLGVSDCDTYVRLSSRFKNQLTNWYDSPDWLGTVIHELIHLGQQSKLCRDASDDDLEATANIATLEVLAAMANRGNPYAFRAFVWEFTGICLGAAYALAYKERRVDEFEELWKEVHPGILAEARMEKLEREYAGRVTDRLAILNRYYLYPLEIIMRTHLTNNDVIDNPVLPPTMVYRSGSNTMPSYEPRKLSLDDWAYTTGHLLEMAQAYA